MLQEVSGASSSQVICAKVRCLDDSTVGWIDLGSSVKVWTMCYRCTKEVPMSKALVDAGASLGTLKPGDVVQSLGLPETVNGCRRLKCAVADGGLEGFVTLVSPQGEQFFEMD